MVGPNTYFPLTAFSKKQTSTAMSSTEAEVVSANLAMRTVGLPSFCLWQVIRQAGGVQTSRTVENDAKMKKQGKRGEQHDHWEVDPLGSQIIRHHVEPRDMVFVPEQDDKTPVDLSMLSSMSITIAQFEDGSIENLCHVGLAQWKEEGVEGTMDWQNCVQDRWTK